MLNAPDYPAIVVTLAGVRRRLLRGQWQAVVRGGQLRQDALIEFETSSLESRTMRAGECPVLIEFFSIATQQTLAERSMAQEVQTGRAGPAGVRSRLGIEGSFRAKNAHLTGMRAELAALAAMLEDAQRRCLALAEEVERLQTIGASVAPVSAVSQPEPASARPTSRQPAKSAPPPAQHAAKTTASGAGMRTEPSGRNYPDLVQSFNSARGLDELEQLRGRWNARSFTNDRQRNIDQLQESATDRFWVIEDPANPRVALLIPGAATKKRWQTMRDLTADHPLAHHFTLSPGEKLMLLEPAQVRLDESGDWVLLKKGAISGTR